VAQTSPAAYARPTAAQIAQGGPDASAHEWALRHGGRPIQTAMTAASGGARAAIVQLTSGHVLGAVLERVVGVCDDRSGPLSGICR